MDWTDGFGNVPYDPDMTVGEALDLGLIAVMDTGVIGRTWDGPCNYEYVRKDERTYTCLRNKGHKGPHARVLRWEQSWQDIEKIEREQRRAEQERELTRRAAEAEKADLSRRMHDLAQAVAKAEADASRKISKSMQQALDRKIDREWSMVPRNFRDQSAGKVRGPKR